MRSAGIPARIPWSFQYQLSLEYAIGRIHFERLEDYARYARSVVTVERDLAFPREACFFSVRNEGYQATRLSDQYLTSPLHEQLRQQFIDWDVDLDSGQDATKETLSTLFHSDHKPVFLFTSSHVLEKPISTRVSSIGRAIHPECDTRPARLAPLEALEDWRETNDALDTLART